MPRSSGTLSQTSAARGGPGPSNRAGPSQSQSARPTGGSQKPPQENGSSSSVDVELDHMVINLVKTVLNLSVNKHLIKKADLVKNALGGNGRLFAKVIEQAKEELADVFGYKLVETERNKSFILVSTVTCGSVMDMSEDYRRKYTLLYLVLGYIYMKNGDVPEQGLWDFLAKLNISDEGEHSFFGDVRKLITETFVKQAYLVRTKQVVEGMNDDRFFYGWGARAEHELSKKDILESICKLMGKPSICYITQHAAAYGLNDDDEGDESMDVTQN
nr:non-structural maintenance of chromosomes element 3 homolog [Aedes albopictus]